MILNQIFNDKRSWIGLIAVILATHFVSKLNTLTDASGISMYMLVNTIAAFFTAALGGFIARRRQFVVLWILYFLIVTCFAYWVLYNIPGGTQTVQEFVQSSAGWSGLILLAGITGVYIGVNISNGSSREI